MTREKVHILRCASAFGVAAYAKIRLTSQASRTLSLELFDASSNDVIPAQAGIQKIVVRVFRPVKKPNLKVRTTFS
jgi:hypothetical protein